MKKRAVFFYLINVIIVTGLSSLWMYAGDKPTAAVSASNTRADIEILPATNSINPQPYADRSVVFNLSDTGTHTPILW
ncbi:MAG: hypothetical protein PHT87_09055, partial [Bacteroidales bacterium]|nr:hypothetical protein [Bacteroidales bacterium]